jgi:nuclear pore complex protein Nup54
MPCSIYYENKICTEQERLISALVNPKVFNDERDGIIAKWNQLQAFYGFGKLFFQNASLDVNKENQFSKFKVGIFLVKVESLK